MDTHTLVQCIVMLIGAAAYMAAFSARLHTMRLDTPDDGSPSVPSTPIRASLLGLIFIIAMVIWRFIKLGTVGLYTHIDAFLLLSLLLTGMLFYFRRSRHLGGLSIFLLPMISIVLLLGSVLTLVTHRVFDYRSSWAELHILIVVAGAACFALGCVGGIVYLLADRQLRLRNRLRTDRWLGLPPLASMERFNQLMVAIGFPLLTMACIMGFFHVKEWNTGILLKTVLSLSAWAVYAILLNIRRTPAFRGRRAAWLNIIGFAILLAAFVAVNGMPRT